MDFAPDATTVLLAESTTKALSGVADDAVACGRALAALGALDIDVTTSDGMLQANAVSTAIGTCNASYSLGDQLTALRVVETIAPEHAVAGALRSGTPAAAVGHWIDADRAVVTTYMADPALYVVCDDDEHWTALDAASIEVNSVGFFNPEAPVSVVTLRASGGPKAALIPLLFSENLVMQAADLVGAASEMLRRTREYVSDRVQFDRPIGSFQAIQHKVVDDYTSINAAESVVLYASWICGQPAVDIVTKSGWARAAQGISAEYGFKVMKDSIQMHGGIAATEELWVHHWARRVARLSVRDGNASTHYGALGALIRDGLDFAVGAQ